MREGERLSNPAIRASTHKINGILSKQEEKLHGQYRTLVLVARVGSAFAYSIAIAWVDCFVDTSGPCYYTRGVSGAYFSIVQDQTTRANQYLNVCFELIRELLKPLHLLGRQCIHGECGVEPGMRDGVIGELRRHVVGESRERRKERSCLVGKIRGGRGRRQRGRRGKALAVRREVVIRHEMGIRKIRYGHGKTDERHDGLSVALEFRMTGRGLCSQHR